MSDPCLKGLKRFVPANFQPEKGLIKTQCVGDEQNAVGLQQVDDEEFVRFFVRINGNEETLLKIDRDEVSNFTVDDLYKIAQGHARIRK